jgi:hypothetical protein
VAVETQYGAPDFRLLNRRIRAKPNEVAEM